MLCASRAPLERLQAYKRRMGWKFPWVSSLGSEFNFDFGVSFTEEQQANGAEYNFRWVDDPGKEAPGLSAFALEDGVVYHTYSAYARGTDILDGAYVLLDRAPKGRDEGACRSRKRGGDATTSTRTTPPERQHDTAGRRCRGVRAA
jgi:predicted dithiol-disulfide oxidoreductase (DUF899 family)